MRIDTNKKSAVIPTNDYVFKRIFGHAGNEEITKGLISSIIKQEINNIQLNENPILERDLQDEKLGILDIKAKLNNEITCNIEMQIVQNTNIEKRILFYWSKLYFSGIHVGEDYSRLNKTIAILIADFELDRVKEIPKFHTKWEIREEEYSKIILTNMLEIHIIELPKLLKMIAENKVSKKDKLTLWTLFFLQPEEIGEKEMKENEDIKKAKDVLEEIKQDEREQYLAELRMKYILDQKAIQDYGFQKGIEAGVKEVAKKLKEMGMKTEEIRNATGLTKEEIEKII